VTIQIQARSSDPVGSELSTSGGDEGEAASVTLSVPRPIFVIGSLRSGASILGTSLGQHPSIALTLDTAWIERFGVGLQQAYAEDAARRDLSQLKAIGVDKRAFYAHFAEAINRLLLGPYLRPENAPTSQVKGTSLDLRRAERETAGTTGPYRPTRWVDSSYTHVFSVFLLQQLFPAGRFIHVIREVDEVVAAMTSPRSASIYKSRHVRFTPLDAYEHWLDTVSAGLDAERAFGSDIVLRILRANLVADPEAVLRQCLDFLEEPYDALCLRPFREGVVATDTGTDMLPALVLDDELAASRSQAKRLSAALLAESQPDHPRPPDDSQAARLEQEFVARSGTSIWGT
jgi:Sulfotransferase family